ncbi:hypothetical protein M378DRAFT_27123 [Amanita muscaria Koide BX008]|uniref:Uncharacterized protein n=1 Tax=Amanita muscaria (strain Koide BX008) TaxID=946122 RepID=A0A0C2SYH7_AMAMK|nr:hypothetical protein M378DRAFT_27123 [Amanita muscaria Koide BX008]
MPSLQIEAVWAEQKSIAAGTSNECLVNNVLQRYGKNDARSMNDEETARRQLELFTSPASKQ